MNEITFIKIKELMKLCGVSGSLCSIGVKTYNQTLRN